MQNGFIVSQASKIAELKETLATMQSKLDTASSEMAAITKQHEVRQNEDLVSKYYENGQKLPDLEILCKPIAEAYAETYFDDNFADQARQLCEDESQRFEGDPPDPY
jgi:hypothetical protein